MPTLLVMAAGVGSRYGGFKQIDRVGPAGETLLDYAIFDARRAGFRQVVFVVREELTAAFADLARHLPSDLDVSSVRQDPGRLPSWFSAPRRTTPWGTVHAVLAARDTIGSPFATINADDFYGSAAYRIAVTQSETARTDGTYSAIVLPLSSTLSQHGPVARAICRVGRDRWIEHLEEVWDIHRANGALVGASDHGPRLFSGDELASMNLWVFGADVFVRLEKWFDEFLRAHGTDPAAESRLPEAISDLIQRGAARVRAIETPGPWFGLTHADDRPRVVSALRELHERGEYPTPLWRP